MPGATLHPDPTAGVASEAAVMRMAELAWQAAAELLQRFGLGLTAVADAEPIPGSYWGECEAGVIGERVYARADTPVHSLLHEACHLIVLPRARRLQVHTDATDSVIEEDASCYLQILLGDALAGVGRDRLMADMDAWGYSFRHGSSRAWFERDAEDARDWLQRNGLIDADGRVTALLAPRRSDD